MENGLHNGDLGGHVFKKRIAIASRGKRGGLDLSWLIKKRIKQFLSMDMPKTYWITLVQEKKKLIKSYQNLISL